MYVFDGENSIISLSSGTTSFEVQDLYERWKEWVAVGTNSAFLPALRTVGGDSISTTKAVAPYFFLTNGWKIRPQEADHILVIEGNLFVDGGVGNPFLQTIGAYNVLINLNLSNNATLVYANSSGGGDYSTQLNRIERKVDDLTALTV